MTTTERNNYFKLYNYTYDISRRDFIFPPLILVPLSSNILATLRCEPLDVT